MVSALARHPPICRGAKPPRGPLRKQEESLLRVDRNAGTRSDCCALGETGSPGEPEGRRGMNLTRPIAVVAGAALAASLWTGAVSAQTESASAEDGKPASEAPTETVTAPNVPLGANLTPPLGALPLGPAILSGPGVGQPGSSTVSMAPGTLTTGVAREGINAVRAPEAEPAPAPVAGAAPVSVTETAVTETSAPVAADTDGDGVADSDEVNI